MGSIADFRSASSCPCAGYCGEDSAISPGPVHRRQLCQPHPSNSCMHETALRHRVAVTFAASGCPSCGHDPAMGNLRPQFICAACAAPASLLHPSAPCPACHLLPAVFWLDARAAVLLLPAGVETFSGSK